MTLGGLALAVGILVDDATVEIENTHRNIAMGKPLVRAVLDGASQIAVPTFVSTLSICIVFVPVLLLTGTARYLFTPLAMAVVFAMLASYLLSRTLVPTMVAYLLESEFDLYREGATASRGRQGHILARATICSTPVRRRCASATSACWIGRCAIAGACSRAFMGVSIASLGLVVAGRRGFLPRRRFRPDAAARARSGRHAHRRNRSALRRASSARSAPSIPPDEIEMLIDNIGIPNSWPAIAQGDIPTISSADGEILISLNKEKHGSTRDYEVLLRKRLRERFPGHDVLLPAGQHHQPDSELRPARAHRPAGGRPRTPTANYKIAQSAGRRRLRTFPGRPTCTFIRWSISPRSA